MKNLMYISQVQVFISYIVNIKGNSIAIKTHQ